MKEEPTNGEVIIVLTEHPLLGILLIPYIAERLSDNTLQLTEQAFHASAEAISRMNEAERQAIDIASHYTEKYLMGVYSRETTVSRFLHKLSEDSERIKKNIRPFIEKKLTEMLALIYEKKLVLYQKQGGSKLLYAHHAYHVHSHHVEIRFRFQVNESSFAYQLQCYYKGQPFSISEQKPVQVLTSMPATLSLGMELYFFPDIESSRLLPFTKKKAISVTTSEIQKYIDNILIPIARFHGIETDGLNLIEKERECEPLLVIENTVYGQQLLRLNFRYGDQTFTPDSLTGTDMKRFIYREECGDLSYFRRKPHTEKETIDFLTNAGLQRISDVHFQLSPDVPERTLAEWIYNHRERLKHLALLSGNMGNAPYCLDEIYTEQSCDDGPDWFELHITVVIGDLRIPFTRFRKHILEENREFMLPDGRIILLPEEWFSKYTNMLRMGIPSEKGFRLKHTFIGVVENILDASASKAPASKKGIDSVCPPETLKAQLRPYQQKGFSWMVYLNKEGFGGCLADDMGLGKTLQTLTLLQYIYKPTVSAGHPVEDTAAFLTTNQKPVANAEGQFSLFAFDSEEELLPSPKDIHIKNELPGDASQPKASEPRKPATLIVVPTSLLHNWRQEAKRFTTLSMVEYTHTGIPGKMPPERFFGRFHLVFTTYGIMRKNIDLLRSYCFEYIVLDESQNIKNSDSLTFHSAVQLQSKHKLVLTGTPIENSLKDLWAQFHFIQPDLLGTESSFQKQFMMPIRQGNSRVEAQLQQLTAPFILRRSKREVAPELPPLTEETIYCNMTEEQSIWYEQEKNSLRNILLQHPESAGKSHTFSVLNGILRLRQLACHPQLIFSDFTGTSGKAVQIIETFDTLRSEGHKVLIFSSFVKHLEVLAEAFRERGWKYALLTGSTDNRPSEIAHFTDQSDVQAFLISLKAGGVGLNLTQADYVFIIDPWWNPAAESQAIARAHRIGQDKQVIAYRFITQNSIEEKILSLQDEKRRLAETFVTDSESLPMLSNEQWTDLLE